MTAIARSFVLASAFATPFCSMGCGAGLPTPLEQAEIADYGSAQLVCIQVAASRDAADGCRNAVKSYWCGAHGPLHEAGACSYAVDGGVQ